MKHKFDIKVPAGKSDFRIRHFKGLSNLALFVDDTDEGKARLISEVTSTSINRVRMLTESQIETIYRTLLVAFQGFKTSKVPPKEITIKGVVYSLIDQKKVGVGWHADFSRCNINVDPVRLACLFYFPKGYIYGCEDESEGLIFPISSRYEDFKEHFPLDVFITCASFFLSYRVQSMMKSTAQKIGTEWMIKTLRSLPFGLGTIALNKSALTKA